MTIEYLEQLKRMNSDDIYGRIHDSIEWGHGMGEISGDADYVVDLCYLLWSLKHSRYYSSGQEWWITANEFHMCSYPCSMEELIGHLDESNQWLKLYEIEKEYSENELTACLCSQKCNIYADDTPIGIVKLVLRLMEIKKNDEIMSYQDILFDLCLIGTILYPNNKFAGYFSDHTNMASYRINIFGVNNLSLFDINDECYNSEDSYRYDKIYVRNYISEKNNFVLENVRLSKYDLISKWEGFPNQCSYAWNECGEAIQRLNRDGKIVALMNMGELSGEKTFSVRDFLINKGMVEGVIALPEKMFENTWVNPYLVILSKDNSTVRFLDARDYYSKSRKNGRVINLITDDFVDKIYSAYSRDNEELKTITKDELAQNDYSLLPQRYCDKNNFEKVIMLGDIIIGDIQRGITLSSEETDALVKEYGSGYPCITPACIGEGTVQIYKYFDKDKYSGKCNSVSPGWLLINKGGKPYKCAIADDFYYVIGNTYILYIDESIVTAAYVKSFLESKRGQDEIDRYSTGTKSKMISVANLKQIRIPVYEGEIQKKMNEKANELTENNHKCIKLMKQNNKELSSMFENIY